MLEKLHNHLQINFPFLTGKKLLLAISGGVDSMVLLHLFQQIKFPIAVAHCNFQLRGLESFEDQKFVQDYAESNNIPFYSTIFDTNAFAEDYQVSIQMAARELRYHWFYELLDSESYDYIVTAHHADDNLETFIINLSRGTGLDGLSGIPAVNDKVVRPLLNFSREEIEAYANKNNVPWREDSSNASTKYLRNKIRHELVPILKEINPEFLASFQKTQSYLQEAQQMVEDASILVYQQVANEVNSEIHFDLQKLQQLPNYHAYLYSWLKNYGFSDWTAIQDLVESQTGKQVFSPSFRLLKDRSNLILSPNAEQLEGDFFIEKGQMEVKIPLNMILCKVTDISKSSNSSIFVDEDKLSFPLQIRKWRDGDVFQPFGMNGQTKKISKLFKDEKLSLFEKESKWLLCSDQEIVWVIGMRADERFKIEESTKNIINISVHP
ncbi:MAG: tRNA lysidine(34) synthetase TilS [Flavobacterium sp.]|nr:tRNA lysidine(34) synthetase TilS [Flavobacterium sp.]